MEINDKYWLCKTYCCFSNESHWSSRQNLYKVLQNGACFGGLKLANPGKRWKPCSTREWAAIGGVLTVGHAWKERKKYIFKKSQWNPRLVQGFRGSAHRGRGDYPLSVRRWKEQFCNGNLCSCALFHTLIDPSAEFGGERFQIASR